MEKKEAESLSKYIVLAVIILLLILSYFIVKPYIIALMSAFILAYIIYPFHIKLSKKINKHLSAILCILAICLIIILPLISVIGGMVTQAYSTINDQTTDAFLDKISSYQIFEKLNIDFGQLKEQIVAVLISLFSSAAKHLPNLIISILIFVVGTYYILLNWVHVSTEIKKFLPFKNKDKISNEISDATKNIIYGTFLISLIEFLIAVIVLYFIGVKAYLIIATLIFISGFVPLIGPGAIWLPTAIYYLFTGDIGIAIGVIIMGLVLSIAVDNILRVKIISNRTKINPLIILLGVFGGISLFGIFGFIVGPLILVYTIKILQESIQEIRN